MGNSCSSGHRDKDDVSQNSGESPSYRVTKPSIDATPEPEVPRSQLLLDPQKKRDNRPLIKGPMSILGTSLSESLPSPVTCGSPNELEGPPVPYNVATLPEDHRLSLLGRPPATVRSRRRNTMVIYVCAADSQDCSAEKGALQYGAAARLRVRARKFGWRLHVADLHWRSPLEQQIDHRFPDLCVSELARQSELGAVVPVLFLNSGLGTPLLPHTIDSADFKTALDACTDPADKTLLEKWYTLDKDSSLPCYRLVRGAPARWRREMARTLNVLVRTLPQEACDAYLTTVVEQEVQHTVLMSAETARRCVWVCRGGSAGAGGEPHQRELQRRLANLQRDLKSHLTESNIIRASIRGRSGTSNDEEYAEGVRTALAERLDAILDALVADNDTPIGYNGIPADLLTEVTEHILFCQKAAQSTSNREVTMNELKTYVSMGTPPVPLVVLGGAGCGKATVVSRGALSAPLWTPHLLLLVRYVGLTARAASSHLVLRSLVDQCHVLVHGAVYRRRNDVATLTMVLQRLLKTLGRMRPVLLVIVGADLLRSARWLPSNLPPNVRMILTVTEEKDDPSSSAIMAVVSSESGPRVVRCGGSGGRGVLEGLTGGGGGRGVSGEVLAAVDTVNLPLYAKTLAWQISISSESYSDHSESEPTSSELIICPDLETQMTQILVTTEKALGAECVKWCLALITASRRGLDDTEILDLLAHHELFRSEETYLPWAPASLFWPQLAALLSPWVRWDRGGAARWRDSALAATVHDRYLTDNELEIRTTLVDYFEGKWFEENDPKMSGRLISQENKFSEDFYNTRKLDELPFQHYHLLKSKPEEFALKPYFTDHSWIHDKIAATDCTHFLEDIALIHLDPLPEHIVLLKDFLETNSYALDYDHRQFYSLLKLYLERKQRTGTEIKSNIALKWLEIAQNPPIPTLVVINDDFHKIIEARERRYQSHFELDNRTYDLIVRLENCGKYVATVSTDREEICVWDTAQCRRVRTLLGIPYPINLVPIDQFKCVVLCRRELRVYDLDKGEFVVALKGVMNQKMPYYGLHDPQHLVALSRNRMYVNLMNIETGDCVTTFKAGEDRFLNSLLVSGDGRILVCGDETQKPFPLLVWSLASRKLLYDLRIPHHDFITAKAAITYEGSYVCVVARELDEPGPNFIVVYDLQSGTLFKKWKPGCDCCCLAISSEEGCVVSGLADTRILVWDLITGNCRLSLRGHTSAPVLVSLARKGGALLSSGGVHGDTAIRLWDLHTGNLIAVYTPPEKVTACDILCGGSLIPLVMENCRDLIILRLDGPLPEVVTNAQEPDEEYYGNPENNGKTFDLKGSSNTAC